MNIMDCRYQCSVLFEMSISVGIICMVVQHCMCCLITIAHDICSLLVVGHWKLLLGENQFGNLIIVSIICFWGMTVPYFDNFG